jgi:hypothetical protein
MFFQNRVAEAHETFPALARLIARDYRLVTDLGYARIYARQDVLTRRRIRGAVEALDALVVHVGVLRSQEIMNAPITEPAPGLGDIDDGRGQRLRLSIGYGRMAITVSGKSHKTAGAAL